MLEKKFLNRVEKICEQHHVLYRSLKLQTDHTTCIHTQSANTLNTHIIFTHSEQTKSNTHTKTNKNQKKDIHF